MSWSIPTLTPPATYTEVGTPVASYEEAVVGIGWVDVPLTTITYDDENVEYDDEAVFYDGYDPTREDITTFAPEVVAPPTDWS